MPPHTPTRRLRLVPPPQTGPLAALRVLQHHVATTPGDNGATPDVITRAAGLLRGSR